MFRRLTRPVEDIDQYLSLIDPQLAHDLTSVAGELQHLRFVHINSTATGGGVAEILQSLVPLMNALGVSSEWVVVDPPEEFFQVTKRIHNLTQGEQGTLSPEEIDIYVSSIRGAADFIQRHQLGADVWFLHDPQLLPLASLLPKTLDETRFWVCHIDWTAPNESVLNLLLPFTRSYDGLVFSRESYVPTGLDERIPIYIAPPAIDPLSPKNVPLDGPEAMRITAAMGIDPGRPLSLLGPEDSQPHDLTSLSAIARWASSTQPLASISPNPAALSQDTVDPGNGSAVRRRIPRTCAAVRSGLMASMSPTTPAT